MTSLARAWLVLAVWATVWALAIHPASAAPAPPLPGGRIALGLSSGGAGPLVLGPGQGGWSGTFTVANTGNEPLAVLRIAIRGGLDDVRSPSRLSVRFVDGASTAAVIAPGATKDVLVSWTPDRAPRVRQAFGHVVVTSTDEVAGEVAMGFRAQLPTGLGWVGAHALSLLVLSPLAIVVVAFVAAVAGFGATPWTRRTAGGVAIAQLLLAAWSYHRFVGDVGRADGNDGFQLIERAVWFRAIGSEWYLGVDGLSMPMVLLTVGVGAIALMLASLERQSDMHFAGLALLLTGITGAFVALDLGVLFASWQVILLALLLMVGGVLEERRPGAGAKLALASISASLAMLLALVALWGASGPSFLVDGARAAHAAAIPELARTAFAAQREVFGLPFVYAGWVLLFAAVGLSSPIVPLHRWLPDLLEQAPSSVGLVVAGCFAAVGPYLLVRVGLGAMPEGARWASAFVAAIGAFGALWASLCAVAQHDVRRFVAYTTIATSGLSLYGIGALTPEGIAGGLWALFARGLAAVLLLGVVAAVDARARTTELPMVGRLLARTPILRTLAGVGLTLGVGAPGLAGSWSVLLLVVGGLVRYPVLAVIVAMAMVAAAAAYVRAGRMLLFGRLRPGAPIEAEWETSNGKVPDASSRELTALVPVAAVAILLGVWPSPVFGAMAVAASDSSADVVSEP